MPKKKRSPRSKRKSTVRSGKSKKKKKSVSLKRKAPRKSARKSASKTSSSSSISTAIKKRKKYTDMQIFRVKLDPHQAVLSCCDQAMRIQVSGTHQCDSALVSTFGCSAASMEALAS